MSGHAHYSEPFQGKDDLWYFHLEAGNGEVVQASEGYESREGAVRGIEAAKRASQEASETTEGND